MVIEKGVNHSLPCSSPTQIICQLAQDMIFGPRAAEMSPSLCHEAGVPGEGAGAPLTDEDVNSCVFITAPLAGSD